MTLDVQTLQQSTIVDQDGNKIGSVGQIYLDDRTNEPTFATVKTGLFGSKETFVPLAAAKESSDGLAVPYTKDFVKDAPNLDADEHLSERQQDEVYRYYGLGDGAQGSGAQGDRTQGDGRTGAADDAGRAGADTGRTDAADTAAGTGAAGAAGAGAGYAAAGDGRGAADGTGADARSATDDRTAGDAAAAGQATGDRAADDRAAGGPDESVTLREERLNVDKERVETGRVRIRKYVVTEQQTVTVPVEREEFEVVREPIADGEHGGTLGGDETAEVRLTEERPVVDKEVVDAERVGLQTHKVTDEQQVQAEVGHEEFEVEQQDGETPQR